MSWHALPTELHLAIVLLLPHNAVRALSFTSSAARALCIPAIFANVTLPTCASLASFARHVPSSYRPYVRSLSICTQGHSPPTDHIVDILAACSRLQTLSLALVSSLDPEKAVSAFSRLIHVQSFHIVCWGREDLAPVSERLVVALAASLPSLSHLSLSRITRSAIHVDPCDVPYGVPIVTNDFDVPAHPILGSDLALPNLLRLPSLRSLEIRDTWMGCDTKLDVAPPAALEKLVITGSMYSDLSESQACTAWLYTCPSISSFEVGTTLAPPPHPSTPPRVSHVHVNASRIPVYDLSSTLNALHSCSVESISIAYEEEHYDPNTCLKTSDEFARECALEDLQDWSDAVDAFLLGRSKEEWSALKRVKVSLIPDVCASWDC